MVKYNNYTPEFKMEVALEAAKGELGVNEIAGKYQVHSKQVTEWKKRLLESVSTIFEKKPKEEAISNKKEEDLLKKVGQLSMEVDWLKKKLED